MLEDFRSHIKYSVALICAGSGIDGMAHKNRCRRQPEHFQHQPQLGRHVAQQQLGEANEQVES